MSVNFSTISLPVLYLTLTEEVGDNSWLKFEPETLLLHLKENRGVEDLELLREKIVVLKAILSDPDLYLNSADFLLHATKVANNEFADFDIVQIPTSLEYAWFLKQLDWLHLTTKASFKPSGALFHIGEYVLMEDGFEKPCEPFKSILGISTLPIPPVAVEDGLEPPTPQDFETKAAAVQSYLAHMTELSRPL